MVTNADLSGQMVYAWIRLLNGRLLWIFLFIILSGSNSEIQYTIEASIRVFIAVIFFLLFFLGMVPKFLSFSLQLGKMEPLDLYENTDWKCQAPTPRTIKIIVSNIN